MLMMLTPGAMGDSLMVIAKIAWEVMGTWVMASELRLALMRMRELRGGGWSEVWEVLTG